MKLEAKQRLQVEAVDRAQGLKFLKPLLQRHLGKFKPQISMPTANDDGDQGIFVIECRVGNEIFSANLEMGMPTMQSREQTQTALFFVVQSDLEYETVAEAFSNVQEQIEPQSVQQMKNIARRTMQNAEFMSGLASLMEELYKTAKKHDPKQEVGF